MPKKIKQSDPVSNFAQALLDVFAQLNTPDEHTIYAAPRKGGDGKFKDNIAAPYSPPLCTVGQLKAALLKARQS